MKFQSLAAVAALAFAIVAEPASASAANCTETQLEAFAKLDEAKVEESCPTLFLDGDEEIDPSKLGTFTTETLKAVAPCKEKTCLNKLKAMVEATPDCSVQGLNIKVTNAAMLKLCTEFSAGPVTVDTAVKIFKDISKNMSDAFSLPFDNEGSGSDGSSMDVSSPPVTKPKKPSNTSDSELPTTKKPKATKANDSMISPAPSTTRTSDANTSTVAALVAFITTSVAASLLL